MSRGGIKPLCFEPHEVPRVRIADTLLLPRVSFGGMGGNSNIRMW